MKLYFNPLSPNSRKVSSVIAYTGLEVEQELVDITKGAGQTPEYRAINPNGMVPALVDGELKLWESNAIMSYLATKAKSDLWPPSEARYDILRWMYWQLAHFGPACDTLTWENMLKGMLTGNGPDAAAVEAGVQKFQRFGAVLNGQLEGKAFVTGDNLTIADFALAAPLTYAGPAQIPVGDFAEITRWLGALDEIPAWRDSAPKMG